MDIKEGTIVRVTDTNDDNYNRIAVVYKIKDETLSVRDGKRDFNVLVSQVKAMPVGTEISGGGSLQNQ